MDADVVRTITSRACDALPTSNPYLLRSTFRSNSFRSSLCARSSPLTETVAQENDCLRNAHVVVSGGWGNDMQIEMPSQRC